MENKFKFTQTGPQLQNDIDVVEHLIKKYDPDQEYLKDDIVTHESLIYICLEPTSGEFDSSKWQESNLETIVHLINNTIQEVKQSGIDVSKLPQLNVNFDSLTEEQYNNIKGKTWYSTSENNIAYPMEDNKFIVYLSGGRVRIFIYLGTDTGFGCVVYRYQLLDDDKYNNLSIKTKLNSMPSTINKNSIDVGDIFIFNNTAYFVVVKNDFRLILTTCNSNYNEEITYAKSQPSTLNYAYLNTTRSFLHATRFLSSPIQGYEVGNENDKLMIWLKDYILPHKLELNLEGDRIEIDIDNNRGYSDLGTISDVYAFIAPGHAIIQFKLSGFDFTSYVDDELIQLNYMINDYIYSDTNEYEFDLG